jgi:hypothetical protein
MPDGSQVARLKLQLFVNPLLSLFDLMAANCLITNWLVEIKVLVITPANIQLVLSLSNTLWLGRRKIPLNLLCVLFDFQGAPASVVVLAVLG